jgi:hypothetical protein
LSPRPPTERNRTNPKPRPARNLHHPSLRE